MSKQYTYMMLKPDAFETGSVDTILERLQSANLIIESSKEWIVDLKIMKLLIDHYGANIETMDAAFNFPGKLFNSFFYKGPRRIMPLKVSYCGEEDIITYTRTLVGATNPQKADKGTIRGDLSVDTYEKATLEVRLVNNLIHASDSHESAKRELALWSQLLP